MTISEYVCELCEYRYEGCGGLGVLMSGDGWQTVCEWPDATRAGGDGGGLISDPEKE